LEDLGLGEKGIAEMLPGSCIDKEADLVLFNSKYCLELLCSSLILSLILSHFWSLRAGQEVASSAFRDHWGVAPAL
jgi:hypothetical protein